VGKKSVVYHVAGIELALQFCDADIQEVFRGKKCPVVAPLVVQLIREVRKLRDALIANRGFR